MSDNVPRLLFCDMMSILYVKQHNLMRIMPQPAEDVRYCTILYIDGPVGNTLSTVFPIIV